MASIIVIGAGAIGSYMALRMAQAGLDPVLVARGARLAQLQAQGICHEMDGKQHFTPITARGWQDLSGQFDTVIICTKTCHFADALHRLAPHAAPGMTLLTVQNGVDAPAQAAIAFPQASVVASRVHGFFEFADGILRHVGVEPSFLLGLAHGPNKDAANQLIALLNRAAIPCALSADIMAALWEKLLLAAPLGGAGAALGLAAGQVMADPAGRAMLRGAMEEVAVLAAARGMALPANCVEQTLAFVSGFPAEATTSLQRDLMAGLPSEYASLIGAVLRMGQEQGLELPVFTRIDSLIRTRFTLA